MKKGNIKHNYVRLHEINSINGVNVECLPSLYSIQYIQVCSQKWRFIHDATPWRNLERLAIRMSVFKS